jgi:hypothetical protein
MSRDIETVISEFVVSLRQTFAEEQSRDRRSFERRAAKIFKKQIMSSRAGRPRKEEVTLAAQMRRQGKPWQQIYAACLPPGLEDANRKLRQLRLRNAVRARRCRERPANQSVLVVTNPGR